MSEFARSGEWSKLNSSADLPEPDAGLFEVVPNLPWDGTFDPASETQTSFAEGAVVVSAGFALARGDSEWIEKLRATELSDSALRAWLEALPSGTQLNGNGGSRLSAYLWALRTLGEERPALDELFLATARVWEWLGDTLLAPELAAVLGPLIAVRWRRAAEHSRWAMRSPALNAPAILAAAMTI
jgi:hypothetical protein